MSLELSTRQRVVALLLIAPFARATPARVHETDTVDGVATTASELVINTTSAATRRSEDKSTTSCTTNPQQIAVMEFAL